YFASGEIQGYYLAVIKLVPQRLPPLNPPAHGIYQNKRLALADIAALQADPLTAGGDVELSDGIGTDAHADLPLSAAHRANHSSACGWSTAPAAATRAGGAPCRMAFTGTSSFLPVRVRGTTG